MNTHFIPPSQGQRRQAAGGSWQLRAAQVGDVPELLRLIRELAAYEQLSDRVRADEALLSAHLFGVKPAAYAWVVEWRGAHAEVPATIGFAVFFTNFSTFLARPGLYLEDLYIQPAYRRLGIGQALLRELAQLACRQGFGRFEWSVLDWNQDAIAFYEHMGAQVLPDWRICRLTGAQLAALGSVPGPDELRSA
jgi:GNAT superfamily N-acetyltransferase